jgi:hypothetical protein
MIKPKPKGKKLGSFLDINTIHGLDGEVFIAFKVGKSYHTYQEVRAKDVAIACGAKGDLNTRALMAQVFKRKRD